MGQRLEILGIGIDCIDSMQKLFIRPVKMKK